jgi:hypothetical protein
VLPLIYAWFYATAQGRPIGPEYYAPWAVAHAILLVSFVWPLLGVHRLMQKEKARLQSAAAERLQKTLADLDHRVETSTPGDMGTLKTTLDSLVLEQGLIDKISTWPWPPETVRLLGTAVVLPVILLILDQLVRRRLGF